MKNDNLKEQYRINERIRVREVRLVGDNIETGVYPIAQALKIAEEQGMDLVEISPNAAPPVCRVIDYQKFLYQQKKRQKEQKAKSVKVVVKEIRFGPQTDDHDYNFKLKHAKGFLEEGSKVKAYVFFKGRSILFKGKRMIIMLTPKKAGTGSAPAAAAAPKVVKKVITTPKPKSEGDKKTEE